MAVCTGLSSIIPPSAVVHSSFHLHIPLILCHVWLLLLCGYTVFVLRCADVTVTSEPQICWLVNLSVVYTYILAYCVKVWCRKTCFVLLGSYWKICSFLGAGKSMSTPQDLFRSSGKVFLTQTWLSPRLWAQCERNAWVLRACVWIKRRSHRIHFWMRISLV